MPLFMLELCYFTPCADNNSKSIQSMVMKLNTGVNRHKRKDKFEFQHDSMYYARVMPLFMLKLCYFTPCADNNSKSFQSMAMKLNRNADRHKRKVKFEFRHYRINYARVMLLFMLKLCYCTPSADNNSKRFPLMAMKLYRVVNRHKRKVKFEFHS